MWKNWNFLVFFVYLLLNGIIGHEVCLDMSGAEVQRNDYCTDYNGYSCCNQMQDNDIKNMINSLGIKDQTCLNFIKKISCATCEPWGAHLFGIEDSNPTLIPDLCPDYCNLLYKSCSNIEMNWPKGKNPFNGNQSVISAMYPSSSSFCKAFAPSVTNPDYCYKGLKFKPAAAPVPSASAPILCLEFVSGSSFGDDKAIKLIDLHDSDGKLLIAQQNGKIRMISRKDGKFISDFLDVPATVDGEAGLHGIAAHPKFQVTRKIYVYYSSKNRKAECEDEDWCNGDKCIGGYCENYITNVLEEYFVPENSTVASPNPLRTLLTLSKPFPIHNGGDITFGKDGKLYIPTGDGGSFNDPFYNSQNLNRRTGKILRIDVDSSPIPGRNYGLPLDNPFPFTKFPEVYALGFRNPWRISFDFSNPKGILYVGDAGQDNREEINRVEIGKNYGWPKYEGSIITPTRITPNSIGNHVFPIVEFNAKQAGSNTAVIGGYVYRGNRDKCQRGKYIFGNWNSGIYYSVQNQTDASWKFDPSLNSFNYRCAMNSNCQSVFNVASFSEDDYGDLYILGTGGIHRIVEPSRCHIPCSV